MLSSHALLFLLGSAALLLAACSGTTSSTRSPADAPIVARIDGVPLTLPAFEAQYLRTTGQTRAEAATDSMAAYRDFLTRFVDYRLKVRAAEDAGMLTDSLAREVAAYRAQTARPRLLRRAVLEPITRTLYERQRTQVAVRHLLIRVAEDAAPSDTLAAYRKADALRDSVRQGADFGALALRHSEDPSARHQGQRGYRGDLGYVSGGQLVESFEDAAFNAPAGEVVGPVRTRFGYHLLRAEGHRPTPPQIRVSHLLLRPDGSARADSARARRRADSLRQRVLGGERFAALARAYSQDPGSAENGGDLGRIARDGRLPQPFEDAAFALDSVGTLSPPVQTRYGFHLIQLTERAEPPAYDEAYEDLQVLAGRLPRTQRAEQQYAAAVRLERGARLDTSRLFAGPPAEELIRAWRFDTPLRYQDRVVAALGDSAYTLSDLGAYARHAPQRRPDTADAAASLLRLADTFLNDAALRYETAALEKRDPEFKALVEEYRGGLLLFQFMQDSIWTPAAQDTAALRARFEAHRAAYRLPARLQTFAEARSAVLRDEQDARERALLRRLRRRYAAQTYPGRLSQAFGGEPPGTTGAGRP